MRASKPALTRDALFDALLAEPEPVIARIAQEIREQLPAYRALPVEVMERDVRLSFTCMMESARAGYETLSESEVAALAAVGESQASREFQSRRCSPRGGLGSRSWSPRAARSVRTWGSPTGRCSSSCTPRSPGRMWR